MGDARGGGGVSVLRVAEAVDRGGKREFRGGAVLGVVPEVRGVGARGDHEDRGVVAVEHPHRRREVEKEKIREVQDG